MTSSEPALHQVGPIIQEFGALVHTPIALGDHVRTASVEAINPILADTLILAALYKKMHWQMRGATYMQLHLLLDKHNDAQEDFVDLLAERIMTLGGVSVADPRLAAEFTAIPRAPDGVEMVPAMLSRLLEAHATIIERTRAAIMVTADLLDWGTNDLLMSDILRGNEFQVWFLSEHLVDTPLVRVP